MYGSRRIYSGTSEQGTRCREVVLFSEVGNVLNYIESKYLGPRAVSLVESFVMHCPYLGGSTIGGFTVF